MRLLGRSCIRVLRGSLRGSMTISQVKEQKVYVCLYGNAWRYYGFVRMLWLSVLQCVIDTDLSDVFAQLSEAGASNCAKGTFRADPRIRDIYRPRPSIILSIAHSTAP